MTLPTSLPVPNISAPHPAGAAGRRSTTLTERRAASAPASKRRSMRELTPFVFLAMILIPSLIVFGLALADPGTAPATKPAAPAAVAATPGP